MTTLLAPVVTGAAALSATGGVTVAGSADPHVFITQGSGATVIASAVVFGNVVAMVQESASAALGATPTVVPGPLVNFVAKTALGFIASLPSVKFGVAAPIVGSVGIPFVGEPLAQAPYVVGRVVMSATGAGSSNLVFAPLLGTAILSAASSITCVGTATFVPVNFSGPGWLVGGSTQTVQAITKGQTFSGPAPLAADSGFSAVAIIGTTVRAVSNAFAQANGLLNAATVSITGTAVEFANANLSAVPTLRVSVSSQPTNLSSGSVETVTAIAIPVVAGMSFPIAQAALSATGSLVNGLVGGQAVLSGQGSMTPNGSPATTNPALLTATASAISDSRITTGQVASAILSNTAAVVAVGTLTAQTAYGVATLPAGALQSTTGGVGTTQVGAASLTAIAQGVLGGFGTTLRGAAAYTAGSALSIQGSTANVIINGQATMPAGATESIATAIITAAVAGASLLAGSTVASFDGKVSTAVPAASQLAAQARALSSVAKTAVSGPVPADAFSGLVADARVSAPSGTTAYLFAGASIAPSGYPTRGTVAEPFSMDVFSALQATGTVGTRTNATAALMAVANGAITAVNGLTRGDATLRAEAIESAASGARAMTLYASVSLTGNAAMVITANRLNAVFGISTLPADATISAFPVVRTAAYAQSLLYGRANGLVYEGQTVRFASIIAAWSTLTADASPRTTVQGAATLATDSTITAAAYVGVSTISGRALLTAQSTLAAVPNTTNLSVYSEGLILLAACSTSGSAFTKATSASSATLSSLSALYASSSLLTSVMGASSLVAAASLVASGASVIGTRVGEAALQADSALTVEGNLRSTTPAGAVLTGTAILSPAGRTNEPSAGSMATSSAMTAAGDITLRLVVATLDYIRAGAVQTVGTITANSVTGQPIFLASAAMLLGEPARIGPDNSGSIILVAQAAIDAQAGRTLRGVSFMPCTADFYSFGDVAIHSINDTPTLLSTVEMVVSGVVNIGAQIRNGFMATEASASLVATGSTRTFRFGSGYLGSSAACVVNVTLTMPYDSPSLVAGAEMFLASVRTTPDRQEGASAMQARALCSAAGGVAGDFDRIIYVPVTTADFEVIDATLTGELAFATITADSSAQQVAALDSATITGEISG